MKTVYYLENRLDISLVPRLFTALVGYLDSWVIDWAVIQYDAQ